MQRATATSRTLDTPALGRVYFNAQSHFLTISENLQANYAFDREGRFLSSFLGGVNYRRGLRGDILMKYFAAHGAKVRRLLTPDESHCLIETVLERVAQIRAQVPQDQPDDLHHWLDAILSWNAARFQDQRADYQAIYKPISILPPDQYLAVVLQAAEGCSWNQCSFCTLYRDRKFRIKSPQEFRRHIQQIKAFFGRGIGMRRSIFLGDANALIIPQRRLLDLLQVIHAEFPNYDGTEGAPDGMKGIYAFLDIFGAEQKGVEQYRELREHGVRRVYIGLESGDDAVFRLLNKPGSPQACIEAVRAIKAAGINIGLILLAGAGGDGLAAQHVANSLATIAAMGLGEGDLVYFSPLIVADDAPYTQQLRDMGMHPLDQAAIDAQLNTLKAGARAVTNGGAKVALYHIEEFIY